MASYGAKKRRASKKVAALPAIVIPRIPFPPAERRTTAKKTAAKKAAAKKTAAKKATAKKAIAKKTTAKKTTAKKATAAAAAKETAALEKLRRKNTRLAKKIAKLEAAARAHRAAPPGERAAALAEKREAKATLEEAMVSSLAALPLRRRRARVRDLAAKFKQRALALSPKRQPRLRKFTRDSTLGDELDVRIERYLDETTENEIFVTIERATMRFTDRHPLWYATFFLSGLGEEIVGSPKVLTWDQLEGVPLQELGIESTGVWRTRVSLLAAIREELQNFLAKRFAATLVWLHHVHIQNYAQKL